MIYRVIKLNIVFLYHIKMDNVKLVSVNGVKSITDKYQTDFNIVCPVFKNNESYMNQLIDILKDHAEFTYVIAYCNSLEYAKKFNLVLNSSRLSSAVLSSADSSENNEIFEKFNNGKIRVICTINAFADYINLPISNTVLFVEQLSTDNMIPCINGILKKHENKLCNFVILPSTNEMDILNMYLHQLVKFDKRFINCTSRARISLLTSLDFEEPIDDDIYEELYEKIFLNLKDS